MTRASRVLLVDDHPVVLSGLATLLGTDPALEVVASVGSAGDARDLAVDPPPDVAVVDLHLPDGDGVSLGIELKQRWPGLRVLVLTMNAEPAAVVRSVGSGLDGYVLKDSDPQELVAAVRAAAAGSVVLGRGASAPLAAAASLVPQSDPLAVLDARDREILALLVDGLSASQVGQRLFLAPKTVRNRVSEMVAKLGAADRDEVIALARSARARGDG